MPRRTYVRIVDGIPTFPLNRPIQEGDAVTVAGIPGQGSIVRDENGRLIGRMSGVSLANAPGSSQTVNEPTYRTMMVGAVGSFTSMRIGTAGAPIGRTVNDPTPDMVPVRFPGMPGRSVDSSGILSAVEEDFVRTQGGEPESASALDQLLEDDE